MKIKNCFLSIAMGTILCLSYSSCGNHGCYCITGTWHFFIYRDLGDYLDMTYIFVGTEKQGKLDFDDISGVSGEYTVDAGQVFFRITAGKGFMWNVNEYRGFFITDDLMKGTLRGEHFEMGQVTSSWGGFWNARRVEGRAHRAVF
jgi:hypothetical protein